MTSLPSPPTPSDTHFAPYEPGNSAGIGSGYIIHRRISAQGQRTGQNNAQGQHAGGGYAAKRRSAASSGGGGAGAAAAGAIPAKQQYRSAYPLEDSPAWRGEYEYNGADGAEGGGVARYDDEQDVNIAPTRTQSQSQPQHQPLSHSQSQPQSQPHSQSQSQSYQHPRRNVSSPWTNSARQAAPDQDPSTGSYRKRTNTLPSRVSLQTQGHGQGQYQQQQQVPIHHQQQPQQVPVQYQQNYSNPPSNQPQHQQQQHQNYSNHNNYTNPSSNPLKPPLSPIDASPLGTLPGTLPSPSWVGQSQWRGDEDDDEEEEEGLDLSEDRDGEDRDGEGMSMNKERLDLSVDREGEGMSVDMEGEEGFDLSDDGEEGTRVRQYGDEDETRVRQYGDEDDEDDGDSATRVQNRDSRYSRASRTDSRTSHPHHMGTSRRHNSGTSHPPGHHTGTSHPPQNPKPLHPHHTGSSHTPPRHSGILHTPPLPPKDVGYVVGRGLQHQHHHVPQDQRSRQDEKRGHQQYGYEDDDDAFYRAEGQRPQSPPRQPQSPPPHQSPSHRKSPPRHSQSQSYNETPPRRSQSQRDSPPHQSQSHHKSPSHQSHRASPPLQSHRDSPPYQHDKHATVSSGGKTRKETHHLGESEGYDVGAPGSGVYNSNPVVNDTNSPPKLITVLNRSNSPPNLITVLNRSNSPPNTNPTTTTFLNALNADTNPNTPFPFTHPHSSRAMASTDTWSLVAHPHEMPGSQAGSAVVLERYFGGVEGVFGGGVNGGVNGVQGNGGGVNGGNGVNGNGGIGAGGGAGAGGENRDRSKSLPDHGLRGVFGLNATNANGNAGEKTINGNGNAGEKSSSRFDAMKSFRAGFPFRRHTTKTRTGHGEGGVGASVGGGVGGHGRGEEVGEAGHGSDNDHDEEHEGHHEDHDHDHELEHDQDHDNEIEHDVHGETNGINKLQRTVSRGQRFTSRAREVREWMRAMLSGGDGTGIGRGRGDGGVGHEEGGGGGGETRPLVWRSKSKKKGKDKATPNPLAAIISAAPHLGGGAAHGQEVLEQHDPDQAGVYGISAPFSMQQQSGPNRGPATRIRLASKNEATSWTGKTRLGELFNRHPNDHREGGAVGDAGYDIRIEPPSVEKLRGETLVGGDQSLQQYQGEQRGEQYQQQGEYQGEHQGEHQQQPFLSSSPLLQPPRRLSGSSRRRRSQSRSVHSEDEGELTEVESRSRTRSPPLVPISVVAARAKSPLLQHFNPPSPSSRLHNPLTHPNTRRTESPLPAPPPTPPTPPSSSSADSATTERVSLEAAQAPQPTYEIVNRRIVETSTERTVEIATWRERVAMEAETSSVGDGNELDVGHAEEGDDDFNGVDGDALDALEGDRGRTVRGRTGGGGGSGMKEHMSVYFVTSDEYALALAEESKLGAALGGRSVEHPGLHSRVEYVDYKTLEEARDRTMDITQVGLGSIKPGPMVGSLSYKHNKERDRRIGREREDKKRATPRMPSIPRTSGATSLNTSRRGRDKEEKERERSFARIAAPLSDKGKGKERAFIKPPSTNTQTETTSDESESEAPPPVRLTPPLRPLSPSKSSASSLPPQLNSYNGHAISKRHDPPLSPRIYIPPTTTTTTTITSAATAAQPSRHAHTASQSASRKYLYTSTPIEPKPGSTAPFHPTQSSGSTISTIASHEKMAAAASNSRGSVVTGTTTPPSVGGGQLPLLPVLSPLSSQNAHYRSKVGSPLPPIIIPTSPVRSRHQPTTTTTNANVNTTTGGGAGAGGIASSSTLTPLLLLPTPPLVHLLPALNSLGITTVAHLKALAQMSPATRDREVRGEAMRLGVSVVEWAMVVDLGSGVGG